MEKAFTSVPISLGSSENTVPCLNLRAVPSVLPMQASLVHLLSGPVGYASSFSSPHSSAIHTMFHCIRVLGGGVKA